MKNVLYFRLSEESNLLLNLNETALIEETQIILNNKKWELKYE